MIPKCCLVVWHHCLTWNACAVQVPTPDCMNIAWGSWGNIQPRLLTSQLNQNLGTWQLSYLYFSKEAQEIPREDSFANTCLGAFARCLGTRAKSCSDIKLPLSPALWAPGKAHQPPTSPALQTPEPHTCSHVGQTPPGPLPASIMLGFYLYFPNREAEIKLTSGKSSESSYAMDPFPFTIQISHLRMSLSP